MPEIMKPKENYEIFRNGGKFQNPMKSKVNNTMMKIKIYKTAKTMVTPSPRKKIQL